MKFFDFSCMLVIEFTVITILELCSAVINGENHVKSDPKSFVFAILDIVRKTFRSYM